MKDSPKKSGIKLIGLLVMIILFTGCSQNPGPNINIENAWGRPSPKVASAGAFYMQ